MIALLSQSYDVTVLFYNPNIQPPEEYDKRLTELRRMLALPEYAGTALIVGEYDPNVFKVATVPFLDEPEGGRRCERCFNLRLSETARLAADEGYSCFTTTLSVSPHKNAKLLNEISGKLAQEYGIEYLRADFKKQDGYKHSIDLSKKYGLYRQSYCGCLPFVQER
ncbi:MAG: epoxyqueuosine reductase QueH [Oscillospiraceae bacterium]|nr:epoxyqueuosine reductase QueH [Oscillospiraceae bacterium]